MIKRIVVLTIVGLLTPLIRAEEKGALLYSSMKRDVALVISDQISNSENQLDVRQMSLRDVPVQAEKSEKTVTVFEVKRGGRFADLALKQKTMLVQSGSSFVKE